MKNYFKTLTGVATLSLMFAFTSCEQARPIKECKTFAEMADPLLDSVKPDWSKASKGLNASFVSIDKKFSKSIVPEVEKRTAQKIVGWKGEKLSAQLLLWAADSTKQVEVEFSDFKSDDSKLPASIAEARFVRYVMTDEWASGGCGYRKPEDFASSLVPDMLDNLDCFNMEGNEARPVWLTVNIPQDAKEGMYKSTVTIYTRDLEPQSFDLNVEVQNSVLPEAKNRDFHLDLWQHPSAVARTQNLEMWSDEHFEALKPVMKMLADAGQKVITATLNKEPWNNQCFDPYADMIIWTKNEDGSWTYDYEVFDRWVQFMMDLGVTKMINCYSVVPWNNEIHYKDGKTGEFVDVKADPETKVFDQMWGSFLADFKKHLKEKGWLEITNIAMDERTPAEMAATIKMLQREAPELGISYADNQKSYNKYPFVKDISVAAGAPFDHADIVDRRSRGLTTTYYVCCSDKFPNTFTFSGAAEATYMSWYGYAADFDGLLRWSYNSWVEKPLLDSRFRTWAAGDTYMVYPEARSSIRFERLVEGLQDIQKLKVLKSVLETLDTPESRAKLEKFNKEVEKFNTITPSECYVTLLNEGKEMINELSR